MNVLFASAEAVPFAKAGGLADVVGSLPKYLRKQKVDARVMMPFYGMINRAQYNIEYAFTFRHPRRRGTADVHVHYTFYDGVPFYLLSAWPLFGEGNYLYTDWAWDVQRFIHFGELVQALAWQLRLGSGGIKPWFPDVIHVHDWHTGLAPFLLDISRHDPTWAQVGSVITIHNMGYQGQHASAFLADAGVPARTDPHLVYQNRDDNLLGIGIAYSDVVNTVSPRYAAEIQGDRFGEGLQDIVRARSATGDVIGILNGLDTERNDPAVDPAILHKFNHENFLEIRPQNKSALQQQMGLPVRPEVPLIGIVTRLTAQKGFDLAFPPLWRLIQEDDVQVVALGTGESWIEHEFRMMNEYHSHKIRAVLGYDGVLAQRIYGSSDLFLMPSRYEPCGTSQMLAMRYGSLPIVRETGGLADTVINYDNGKGDQGTGFVFMWEEADAVLNTTRWAIRTYRERPEAFQRMQRRAMGIDFSWDKSAGEYIRIYERALSKHR